MPSQTAIIKKNLHLLHANVVNKEIFPQEPSSRLTEKEKISHKCTRDAQCTNVQHGPKNRLGFFLAKKDATRRHSKDTTVLVSPWDGRHWIIKQHITSSSPNTVYVVMCEVHNEWYVGSTTDLKSRWRNRKSDAKLKKKKQTNKKRQNMGWLTI